MGRGDVPSGMKETIILGEEGEDKETKGQRRKQGSRSAELSTAELSTIERDPAQQEVSSAY